jgi:transposase InsO family protein
LGLQIRSVHRLLAAFRQAGEAIKPTYQRCGRPPTASFAPVRQHTLALRAAHPTWGVGRIHVALRELFPNHSLPNLRTLRRWLVKAGLAPRRCRRPRVPLARATSPHEIWQLDAAEQKSLRSQQKVCWLRLVDEFTGAVLFSWVFPQANWSDVPAAAVQAALQRAFARWGRPKGLRVDNGNPWVSPGDLPSDLELWLAGLDIALHRNRPRRPQDNGKVERSQRTAKDWAEPQQCDSPEQLQRRLDEEDRVQREVYRFDGQQSRRQAFPGLLHSGRAYAAGRWESVCWDYAAALRCLAACVVERKVDSHGKVSLYDQQYWLGKAYTGQTVKVRLDPASSEWVIEHQGNQVKRSPAKSLEEENIKRLQLRRRQGRSAQQTQKRRTSKQATANAEQAGGAERADPAPPANC